MCIIDTRYPKHYLERYPIASNSSDVIGTPTTPPYDNMQLYTRSNTHSNTNTNTNGYGGHSSSSDTILLGSHCSSRNIHLHQFRNTNTNSNSNSDQGMHIHSTSGLSSFLMASKPFGFESVLELGKPTHTPHSFPVNDQPCNVVADNRYKGTDAADPENHGITNILTDGYLCGMFLLDISDEMHKLRNNAQSQGGLTEDDSAGADNTNQLVVCQINNFGNLYIQPWCSQPEANIDIQRNVANDNDENGVEWEDIYHNHNHNGGLLSHPLGLGLTPLVHDNAVDSEPVLELDTTAVLGCSERKFHSKQYRQWVFDENLFDFSLYENEHERENEEELTGLSLLSSPLDTIMDDMTTSGTGTGTGTGSGVENRSIIRFNNQNCILSKIMVRSLDHMLRVYRCVVAGEYRDLRDKARTIISDRSRIKNSSSTGAGTGTGTGRSSNTNTTANNKSRNRSVYSGHSNCNSSTNSSNSDTGMDNTDYSEYSDSTDNTGDTGDTGVMDDMDGGTDSSISDEDLDLLPVHWRSLIGLGRKHFSKRTLLSSQYITSIHLQKLCNYKHQDRVYNILHDYMLFNIKQYSKTMLSLYDICGFLWDHIVPRKVAPPGLILTYKVCLCVYICVCTCVCVCVKY